MLVVEIIEHLRDGQESYTKIVNDQHEALAVINTQNNFKNHTFRLFELGKEIKLSKETAEIPQPSKIEERYIIATN